MIQEELHDIIEHLKQELLTIRTNRANPAMVEGVLVPAYGSTMRLMEVASINVPEPQMLVVQPWDASLLKTIETALRNDPKLQLNPVVDGEIIRLPLPQLTEERRRELVKMMHQYIEQARIAVRKVREDILKEAKAQEKSGEISEDELRRLEKQVQDHVDRANEDIRALSEQKEAELLTV